MKKTEINILIVEDDATQRNALTEAVKRRGYRAVPVAKPDEAASIVKIKPIHALIVDCMLPGRNGTDLVMDLKENLMDGAAIIFISGIYRDRGYAQDAVKKAGALEFYTKPFNIEELLNKLEKDLNSYVEVPKVDLHALLALPFASNRERRKALDHVDELNGYDLPFVFCILMDSESSGHLNIVDADQNIFGVTFSKGLLAKVDSESTVLFMKKLLITHGFISELELSELQAKGTTGDLIKTLVDEGLMSPHVPGIIKMEAIANELKKLIVNVSVKVNFVPDRRIKEEAENIDVIAFLPQLHDMIDELLPVEWLKSFYSTWLGYPIRLGPQYSDHHRLAGLPIIKRAQGIIEQFKKEATIEEILATNIYSEEKFYKALHLLMLRRVLVFEEVRRVKNIDEHVNRLKAMHVALHGKNPIGIFKYFGLSENPKSNDVVRVYKEFAKSNHPDTLPQTVTSDVRGMNHELFSAVTAAYEILSDETKKLAFFNTIKQSEAELQIKSDDLVTLAAASLARGRYVEALPLLEQADKLYSSERSQLHFLWARLKVDGQVKVEEYPEIEKLIRGMSAGMKKTALWFFLNGLIRRVKGDSKGAQDEFLKVLRIEDNFMDARRELVAIKASTPVKQDLLTGDFSAVIKDLFKKKKKGA